MGCIRRKVVVLAARPSVGKTSLAMNIAENIACGIAQNEFRKEGVLVFSLEMGADQLAMRLLTCRARVSMARIRDGFCNAEEQKRLAIAAREFKSAPSVGSMIPDLRESWNCALKRGG